VKDFIFYLIAVFILLNGFLSVTTRKIFRSAIYLLFALIGIAGIYFWMEYEFIAAVQVAVYVGGIVVLIIFSIFLTQQSGKELPVVNRTGNITAGIAALSGFLFTLIQIYRFNPGNLVFSASPSVEAIGEQLLSTGDSGYALPFEIISTLLLAAMIACIVIAMKTNPKKA